MNIVHFLDMLNIFIFEKLLTNIVDSDIVEAIAEEA